MGQTLYFIILNFGFFADPWATSTLVHAFSDSQLCEKQKYPRIKFAEIWVLRGHWDLFYIFQKQQSTTFSTWSWNLTVLLGKLENLSRFTKKNISDFYCSLPKFLSFIK